MWVRQDLAPSMENGPAPLNKQVALSMNYFFMAIFLYIRCQYDTSGLATVSSLYARESYQDTTHLPVAHKSFLSRHYTHQNSLHSTLL